MRCQTRLSRAALSALPGVQRVDDEPPYGVRLLTTDADQTLRALLRQDETACNLDVRSVGLEDAFLALTSADHEMSSPPAEGAAMTTATAPILELPAPAQAVDARTVAEDLRARDEIRILQAAAHAALLRAGARLPGDVLSALRSEPRRTDQGRRRRGAQYLLASYSIFGVVTAALFAFGAGVATERALGWLVLKRATPMPVSAYLAAKVASAMLFGTVILIMMAFCADRARGRAPVDRDLADAACSS